MDANAIWKVSTGKGVKVAVVDTGVNSSTSSLKGQVLPNPGSGDIAYHATKDYNGHGTSMAEIIAGTGNGGGIKGLAPGAKIVPYRIVLKQLTDKQEKKRTATPAAAVRAAADSDAQIINMSFGQKMIDPDMQAAIKYASSKGKLMFAGVGNDAGTNNFIDYPAAYDGVVGVSAADESGKVSKFSEHGAYVDLAAPGQNMPIWCDASFKSYCDKGEGTSVSTAIASASAALVWSAHPGWTANQVLRVLLDTASRSWPKSQPSNYLGYGLIRPARNLLHGEGKPGAADVDPISNEKTPEPGSRPATDPPTSASGSSQPTQKASDVSTEAAGSESRSSSGSNKLWPALVAVAALVVLGGGGWAVWRARRT
ncbi:S8 family serine peptidase [Streptomyces beihaiensis]|uniref:S8 family serine peptidase n=1 Tax=Streptomyces beihaiensis TaxID=2984495 RepID=A0ABT3TXN1_9ACTN|nr:S8 family serine peptidase [Streptomyces beihaiensis]MCX3061769.1 S8 family serine peptidase [Streptomyces beihaiensis]